MIMIHAAGLLVGVAVSLIFSGLLTFLANEISMVRSTHHVEFYVTSSVMFFVFYVAVYITMLFTS